MYIKFFLISLRITTRDFDLGGKRIAHSKRRTNRDRMTGKCQVDRQVTRNADHTE